MSACSTSPRGHVHSGCSKQWHRPFSTQGKETVLKCCCPFSTRETVEQGALFWLCGETVGLLSQYPPQLWAYYQWRSSWKAVSQRYHTHCHTEPPSGVGHERSRPMMKGNGKLYNHWNILPLPSTARECDVSPGWHVCQPDSTWALVQPI